MNFNIKNFLQVLLLTLLVGISACTEDACDTIDCGEHGVDCQEGVCICETGWFGANCQEYDCVLSGLGCVNGDCLPDGTCDCDPGFFGPDCSSTTPVEDCADIECGPNSTGCVDGVCVCAAGFFGADCTSTDPCVEVTCGTNSVAVASEDGTTCACECLEGYTGENCELLIYQTFLGSYSVSSTCGPNYLSTIVAQTENGVAQADKVKITNFSNLIDPDGGANFDIVATIASSNELNILFSSGTPGYTVIGSAFFTTAQKNVLSINYDITDNVTGVAQNCTDTFTRQ